MTGCERIRADAPGLVALPAGDPEREAAFAHARGCEGCAGALREAERLQALLGALEPEPLPAGALARASAAIEEELVRERRRRSVWAAGAAAVLAAAIAGLARHREGLALDWALAGALAAVAVALAAIASRRPGIAIAGAAAAMIAAAGTARASGSLEAGIGLHCLLTELASAGALVWVGWVALRGSATRPARSATAAAAGAGALAAAAALQVTCGAHGLAGHFLLFHAGGLLLAVAAAGAAWRGGRVAIG
jgi:hypothetical protein